MENVGFTKVSFQVLAEAMAMPPDHKIKSVYIGWEGEPLLNVIIEGPKMPEHTEGEKIKEVFITLQKNEIKWIKVERA